VWDAVRKGVLETLATQSALKRYLFHTAYAAKLEALKNGQDTPIWNSIVFNKLKQRMGGRLRAAISGGAPLSRDTQEFIQVTFGIFLGQGYGLTETCAGKISNLFL
jgi:long-chain acyl-CoA synthetase